MYFSVIPRLDRGIQYAAALIVAPTAPQTGAPEYCVARSRSQATTKGPKIKKAGQCPPFSKTPFDPDARAELKTPPGPEDYFFFLAFDFFAFFAFFAFLAIVSSQEFHGLKRDYEACSAEGQPYNILDGKLSRFAARCLALSRQRHRVIHSCYAF